METTLILLKPDCVTKGRCGEVLKRFKKILVPELNMGHLAWLLRARYLVDAKGYNKVQGQPFKEFEILRAIDQHLDKVPS